MLVHPRTSPPRTTAPAPAAVVAPPHPTLPALAPADDRPLESFAQLDAALRIVTVRSWVLLGVLGATLGGFAVFSWFYQAPLKVEGRGIILEKRSDAGDSLLQVTAPAAGRVAKVVVKIGATVAPGDLLGEVDQSDLRDKITEAEAELNRLRDEDERLTRFDDDEAAKRAAALGELERSLRDSLALDRGRLGVLRVIAAADDKLKRQGLLNSGDALKSRAEADAVESAVRAAEARLAELDFQRLQDQTTRRRDKLKRTLGIQAAEIKRDLLRSQYQRDTRIVSPYGGQVVDLMLTPHALIEKGAPAALLQPERRDEPMEAIVFVPAGLGKKVRPGDDVEVSPDSVRRHEHGFVLGQVQSISEIPATEMAMLAELKHKTLVASFLEQYAGQVLLSIRVKLRDVREETGVPSNAVAAALGPEGRTNWLRWSSSSGARQRVSTGTLCSASVVVERRPLVTLAIPWVKQMFGMD
jgi:HlyD family secretion protein